MPDIGSGLDRFRRNDAAAYEFTVVDYLHWQQRVDQFNNVSRAWTLNRAAHHGLTQRFRIPARFLVPQSRMRVRSAPTQLRTQQLQRRAAAATTTTVTGYQRFNITTTWMHTNVNSLIWVWFRVVPIPLLTFTAYAYLQHGVQQRISDARARAVEQVLRCMPRFAGVACLCLIGLRSYGLPQVARSSG